MSLLMDALKKAEEAKRQSAVSAAEPQEHAASAEAEAPAERSDEPQGLPELPSSLELLDHQFHTEPQAPPPAAAASAPPKPATDALKQERAAAKNVFQAKQPAPRNNFLIVAGMAGLLAALGIGGYFWWQLQPGGGIGMAQMAARTTPSPASISPPPAAVPAPAPTTPAAAAPEPEDATPAAVPPAGRPAAPAKPAAAEADSPIRITTGQLQVNPKIASAYQAFQSGDLAAAEADYRQALKIEPKNTDALHGLAAIGLRQGRADDAVTYYLSILEADPKDTVAHAALLGLRGQGDPLQAESRLKNLLAGQPDSPALYFALGNLYASQRRWNEAQQAYFRACAGDGENPDYLFNLAVSLEQLRQPRLALQYYQGALSAAAQRPAAFDRNQVAGRIRELQQ